MSGHSKWASIKRSKGAADQKRGAVFSKLAKAISVAARHGADPAMNFALRIAIDQAKAANMPKDNIERAIERASGKDGTALEEITFELYGPGGTAFLVETASDNHNRTISDIRAVLNKHGGKLAETGSVGYLFKKLGTIVIETADAEAIELAAIDAGAADVEQHENPANELGTGQVVVSTDPKELEHVRRRLAEQNIEGEAGFEWQPLSHVSVAGEMAAKVIKLAEVLDDLDDVTAVHSNFEITA
ncbi:MAG TPA: YebC/PmpR family DNA-binding transcriptional regulator [Candidatus Saccharimonadales bacterium]|nr:YebC/PmpR family DNA-binding transcriptional regulator [Candidatus Saccharimonadales bacterium]